MSTEIVRYHRVTGVPGVLWRGAVSGLAGAVAFVVWVTLVYALVETPWLPLNLVAATWWSGAPDGGTFSLPAALLAVAVILAVGVLLGVGYGVLAVNLGLGPAMLVLIAVTLTTVLWIFGHFLVWPAIDGGAASRFDTLTSWSGHVVYGLVMGFMLMALRRGSTLTERPGGDPSDFTYGTVDKPLQKPGGPADR